MKLKIVKSIVLAFAWIAGAMTSLTAEAVAISGKLGASAAAVDAWRFICPTGTAQVRVSVKDDSGIINTAAIVSVSFGKNGTPLTTPVSDLDNENSASSSWATNTTDFAGTYVLVVNKSASNTDDYIAFAECLDSSLQVVGPSTSSILSVVND